MAQLAGAVAVAATTAATWWAWLGWDHEYQVDPVTGQSSGPYEAWQVIGCVLCLVVIAGAGALTLPPCLTPAVLTLTFTGIWSWQAGSTDETGLWGVGAILVFGGLAWGSALISAAVWVGRKVLRTRRSHPLAAA